LRNYFDGLVAQPGRSLSFSQKETLGKEKLPEFGDKKERTGQLERYADNVEVGSSNELFRKKLKQKTKALKISPGPPTNPFSKKVFVFPKTWKASLSQKTRKTKKPG